MRAHRRVYDTAGERLTPTHANKRGVRYRYYVSRRLIAGTVQARPEGAGDAEGAPSLPSDADAAWEAEPSGQRIPAAKLEAAVTDRLRALLGNAAAMQDVVRDRPAPEQRALVASAARLALDWPDLPSPTQRRTLQAIVARIDVHADRIEIGLDGGRLLHRLGVGQGQDAAERTSATSTPEMRLTVPVALQRVGLKMRLMMPDEAAGPDPD